MNNLDILKAMASEVRLEILRLLYTRGPMYVNEIRAFLDIPLGSASSHIWILRDAGIISSEKHSSMRYYSIEDERSLNILKIVFQDEEMLEESEWVRLGKLQ